MISAQLHPDEDRRIAALHRLEILDTATEESYDELVELAASIAGTPISLISLVDTDRQWFKAHHGIDASETSRSLSFCAHAILDPTQPFVVNDTHNDERFADNPLVLGEPKIRFYAGIPIQDVKSSMPVGTLCVISDQPKELSEMQLTSLSKLARQVERTLLLRDYTHQLTQHNHELEIANQAKSRFLDTVSHDIRTPLNGIIGSIESLDENDLRHEQLRNALNTIHHCGNSLLHIINNILDLSSIETGRLELTHEDFDLRSLADDVLHVVSVEANSKQLELISEIDDAVPVSVHGDKTRLHQILLNLLSNAVKFTPSGFVRLTIQPSDQSERISIRVSDSGIGISDADCPHIFESFVQVGQASASHAKGNGLGLSIVDALVKAMGGTIEVSSKEGEGTTFDFTILLPASDPNPQKEASSETLIAGVHVLVVDDDTINRTVMSAILKKLNATVTAVASGVETVDLFPDQFDVILLDCQMPEMDGYETARQWRALERKCEKRAIPILALTAHPFEATRRECIDAGMNQMLTKPINADQLARAVWEALGTGAHTPLGGSGDKN